MNALAIPREMRDLQQWVNWRYETVDGKLTKVPYKPWGEARASATQPATWGTFGAARGHQHEGLYGVGFVFRAGGGLVGVDLDNCRDADGAIAPWARAIIRDLDSYTEISPSGRGVHIIVRGSLPEGGNKRAYETGAVEMYAHGRYFTMTGDCVAGTAPGINERTAQLADWHARIFTPPAGKASRSSSAKPLGSDAEIIERAMSAKNGAKFRALWQGDTSGHDGDESRADQALCNLLAYSTHGDELAIDRLFRQSGLMREKWDREDYRERTIAKALAGLASRVASSQNSHIDIAKSESSSPGDNSQDSQFAESQAPASGEEDENDELSQYASWPDPMRDEAYIGPIGAWVKKLAQQTEAAPEALLLQALAMAGNAMGRSAHVKAEADEHAARLFVLVAGDTASRKGVACNHARRFVQAADSEWDDDHLVNGLSSGEGLINVVRDDEPIIPNKTALVIETEFAAVLAVKKRDGSTLSAVMRQAWDGHRLSTMTKNPLKATGAHISIVGHITPSELRAVSTATDAANGFSNRFLWCCVKRARYLPRGGGRVDTTAEVQALNAAINHGKQLREVNFDPDAESLWKERYYDLSRGRPGLLGAVTSRAEPQVTRLALLYALLDCQTAIGRRHLLAALAVWEYCLASARFLFGEALGNVDAESLLAALTECGENGMSATDISRHFTGHKSAKELAHLISLLTSQGRVEKRSVKGTSGRTKARWYAVANLANRENREFSESRGGSPAINSLNSLNSPFARFARHPANCANAEHQAAGWWHELDGELVCSAFHQEASA